jgi:hypothetical protein
MVNHKVCRLPQRLATIDIYARLEVTLRVHLHESFKEVPLEQNFPINTKTTLRDIINPILPQTRTFIFLIGMFGASLALSCHPARATVPFSRSGEIREMASGISLCDLQPFCR